MYRSRILPGTNVHRRDTHVRTFEERKVELWLDLIADTCVFGIGCHTDNFDRRRRAGITSKPNVHPDGGFTGEISLDEGPVRDRDARHERRFPSRRDALVASVEIAALEDRDPHGREEPGTHGVVVRPPSTLRIEWLTLDGDEVAPRAAGQQLLGGKRSIRDARNTRQSLAKVLDKRLASLAGIPVRIGVDSKRQRSICLDPQIGAHQIRQTPNEQSSTNQQQH